jgi:hypothetical protein
VPLPTLSPEQRAAALEKAAEIRKARAELKEQLKAGKTTLTTVLDRAESDEVVGKLKVSAVLQSDARHRQGASDADHGKAQDR